MIDFEYIYDRVKKFTFWKNYLFVSILSGGIFLNLILLFTNYLGLNAQNNLIQTRFDGFYGVTDTGDWYALYYLYLVGFIILIANGLLAIYAYEKEKLISYFLLVNNIVIQIMLIIQVRNFINLISG